MRIAFDIQTLETYERTRGIGRFARNILTHFVRAFPRHEVVCFGFSPAADPPELPDTPNCSYRPYRKPFCSAATDSPMLDRAEHLDAGVTAPLCWGPDFEGFDVFFAPSALMSDILLPSSAPCPRVALLHDAIPLVFRSSHSNIMPAREWDRFDRRLGILRGFDALVANSQRTIEDFIKLAGFAPERCSLIGAGLAEGFLREATAEERRRLRRKYGLPQRYIITVTGYDFRKNWQGAIEVTRRLKEMGAGDAGLVFVCALQDSERADVEAVADRLEVRDRLRLTGFVPDEDLPGLLAGADCFLFTSLYEGFGFPILEAMACGVPVVTADNSSLPEVAGDAALLCPAGDAAALSENVARVLADPALAARLRQAGRARSRQFTWEAVAARLESTLAGARRSSPLLAVPARAHAPKSKIRVAFFSPLNPVRSGISDYSEELLPLLAQRVGIELFCDGFTPAAPWLRENLLAWDIRAFDRRNAEKPFDLNLYQMGNNEIHSNIYYYSRTRPGLTVIHDLFLLGFFQHLAARDAISLPEFVEALTGCPTFEELPKPLSLDRLLNLEIEKFPCNRGIVESSRAVAVHTDWARGQLEHLRCPTPVRTIPHGLRTLEDLPFAAPSREEARRRIGIPNDAFVVAAAGGLTPLKRLTQVVDAFRTVVARAPNALLVMAGMSDRFFLRELRRKIAEYRLQPFVKMLGYVSMREFYDVLMAADVCLNLRYPTLGETSGSLLRALAAGRPTLVTDVHQYREFPDEVCWKISAGPEEKWEIAESLITLANRPDAREAMGAAALKYVQQFRWPRVAELYARAIEETVSEQRKK